jgi:hypothetical protein
MVIQARRGASPVHSVKVARRCNAPKVGSILEIKQCDQFGRTGAGRWERWVVKAITINGTHLLEPW